jgi:hypothetical protein
VYRQRSQAAHQRNAIFFGHADVADHDIDPLPLEKAVSVGRRVRDSHPGASSFQRRLQQEA